MLIRAIPNGEKDPAEAVRQSLQAQEQFLIIEGQTVQHQDAAAKELRRLLDEFNSNGAELLQRMGAY